MILVGKAVLAVPYITAANLLNNDDGTVTVVLLNGKHLSVNPDGSFTESANNGAYERAKKGPRGLVYWSTHEAPKGTPVGGWIVPLEEDLPNQKPGAAAASQEKEPDRSDRKQ